MAEKRLTPVARKLRRASTDAEAKLWRYLRNRRLDGAKFVRQFPIGPYVADFACRDLRLAIELDGGQHNDMVDAPRTEVIEGFGYRIIRFWNNEVFENLEGVIDAIQRELAIARNTPLSGGRGLGEGVPPYPERPNPLTPALSPPGRGSMAPPPPHGVSSGN